MNRSTEFEETKRYLLQDINKHRAIRNKVPLAAYPDDGCCSCGDGPGKVGPLVQSLLCRVPFLRQCQQCLLEQFPFQKLRLEQNEEITWFGHNPTFHRCTDYGIAQSDRALYLYSPFWWFFSKWKRISLQEITDAQFHDSKLSPMLRVHHLKGSARLRTPRDYADEMEFDRQVLKEAAARILMALPMRMSK